VQFLGSTEVDQPKGIDVVKQGVQKLKFNQMLKKTEGQGNAKTPKVELTISVDGVVIQEPKTKAMMHQYPLHKISYCADDKAEKRFFSFIAREERRSGEEGNKHTCFVFVSDKLVSEYDRSNEFDDFAWKNFDVKLSRARRGLARDLLHSVHFAFFASSFQGKFMFLHFFFRQRKLP